MDEKDEVKANWDLWADMEQAKLWEAVALSLDIEPEELSGLDFRPIYGGPFDECSEDFKLRLKLATSKFHGAKTEIRLSNLREWAEQLTRPWSFPDEFPRKTQAMNQPYALAQNAATPAIVEPATVAPPLKQPSQEARILELLKAQGYDPKNLTQRMPGKPGPKAEIRTMALTEIKLFSKSSFQKAWERLRRDGEIAGAD